MKTETIKRRWRKSKPHCGGLWFYRECGDNKVDKVILTPCGSCVVSDDEWHQFVGRKPENDAFMENYFEGTSTDQNSMPGLWMQAAEGENIE